MDHEYRELPPPTHLADHLRCVWTERIADRHAGPAMRVLPDGCIDIVWVAGLPPVVAGPATRPALPAIPPGATLVGLRFQPGMASAALGIPATELADRDVPLVDLWGRDIRGCLDGFDESRSPRDGLDAMQALLTRRLEQVGTGDAMIKAAAGWLARHPSSDLGRLTDLAGLSERQLRRRFEAAVGYGPKTYQRIIRFRSWLRLAQATPADRRRLVDLAAEAGYADQAHLTREVSRLAGLPPTALLAELAAEPA